MANGTTNNPLVTIMVVVALTATIDSITPSPAEKESNVTFIGTGSDSGFFIGGYCGTTPKVAYSPTDFMDAQARFYGNTIVPGSGLVEKASDCAILWLGHRVSPPWRDRPTSLARR